MENKLTTAFENAKFKVSWDLIPDTYDLQTWDRIEIKEVSQYGDMMVGMAITQSHHN